MVEEMTKLSRHGAILELVKHGPVPNQDELRRELEKRGFRVTQATLSRDIRRLGLIKLPKGYVLAQSATPGGSQPVVHGLERLFREFVREVREAQNLLVVKTSIGSAQPVAVAWDAEPWPEVVGTLAGDDTILVICPDSQKAGDVAMRIRKLIE